jgi:tellurite resistance-related uncharacterized protein
VQRSINGYHEDELGDWVAELSCLHNQHLRHRPPFLVREWVLSETGRSEHLGTAIECPLCDAAELPADLELARTAGPFDATSIPAALRKAHLIAERTWGVLRVLDGHVILQMATEPPFERRLRAGDEQPIPPGVHHQLVVDAAVSLVVDFLVRRPAP